MITFALPLLMCAGNSVVQAEWPPAPPFSRPEEVVGELPASVEVKPAGRGKWLVTFSLPSTVEADRIFLAGSFNSWNSEANAMQRGSDGRWRVELELESGKHLYKFVLGGTQWIADPTNETTEGDGHGGRNSVLGLGETRPSELDEESEHTRNFVAYLHKPQSSTYRQRVGDDHALLRYRATNAESQAPLIVFEGGDEPIEMNLAGEVDGFALYESQVELPEEPTRYCFLVAPGEDLLSDPDIFVLDASELTTFRTPDWAKHATWYQIMPDRFRNGDPATDPERVRDWKSDWYEPSPHELEGDLGLWSFWIFKRLYGGDLAGVREKLDYIQSLGVTAIYFNPVFEAESHHKYEATDYRHIDTGIGCGEDWEEVQASEDLREPSTWVWSPSDKLFLEFVEECHERGLKVIIDGVWNHVGQRHPAFADVKRNGEQSPYKDWFDIVSYEPFEHRGWAGFGDLPAFKKNAGGFACDEVKQHIFEVTRRWMDPNGDGDPSDGIDGWRLDVPMEVPMPFWDEWRALVKSINPDAYLSGEVWQRADDWLNGTRFDAVMNYPFAESAIAWVGFDKYKLSVSELDARLATLRLAYSLEATQCLMNLVDSHDTDRLVSMLLNPDRRYDQENREQDNAGYLTRKPDAIHYRRARLIALFQMTYVGAPMVYYGDEVGMWGPDDPSNRKPMLWEDLGTYEDGKQNRVDAKHLAHYRAIGALRRAHPALRTGSFESVLLDDEQDLYVFLREDADEQVLVALNASDDVVHFELPGDEWRAVFGSAPERGKVRVPAVDGLVLVRHR